MSVVRLSAAVILAASLSGAASAHARLDRGAATVTGSLKGVPAARGGLRIASVRAIDPVRGSIRDAALLRGPLSFRLGLSRGWGLLYADVFDTTGAQYRGTSRIFRVPGPRRVDVMLRRPGRSLQSAAAPTEQRVADATGPIVTWSPIRLTGPGGVSVARIDGFVFTDMLDLMKRDCNAVFVDTTTEFREAVARELALQNAGATSTKLRFNPIKPSLRVVGSGSVTASGGYSVSARVVNIKTGKTVASQSATGSGDSFDDVVAELFRELARKACRPGYERITGTFAGTAINRVYGSTATWSGEVTFVPNGTQRGPDGKLWQRFRLASGQVTVRSAGGSPCALQAGPVELSLADRGEMVVQLTPGPGREPAYYGAVPSHPLDAVTAQLVCNGEAVAIPGWYHPGAYMATGADPKQAGPRGRLQGTATHEEQRWSWELQLD